jgi:endothelin-converting enzyme
VNNASDVVAYYKDTLDGRNHFEYEMSWSQWNTKRQWNRLLQKDPPPDWAVAAWQPHSYYYPVTNEFYIGGGMEAFHGLGWPEYMNYAAIGGIASEKMAQALDPKFFLPRNQYGQVVPGAEGGWDNQTIAEYDKRGTCLHDQFAKHGYHPTDYPIHDTVSTAEGNIQNFHTLGTETDQESVFDFGAVDVAYEAWKRQAEKDPWKARRHQSLKNFTADQLFFISYAQAHYHNNEAHSESRIISLQENSKAFKDAFRCKQKEPVCPLW